MQFKEFLDAFPAVSAGGVSVYTSCTQYEVEGNGDERKEYEPQHPGNGALRGMGAAKRMHRKSCTREMQYRKYDCEYLGADFHAGLLILVAGLFVLGFGTQTGLVIFALFAQAECPLRRKQISVQVNINKEIGKNGDGGDDNCGNTGNSGP